MLKLNLNNNISKRLFYENILIRREHDNVSEKKKQKKLRQIPKIGLAKHPPPSKKTTRKTH